MRCNRSHPCRSFGYSLLAFAAAFIVGVIAAQTVSRIGLFGFTTPAQDRFKLVEKMSFGPCSDNDPVRIRRSFPPVDGQTAIPVFYLIVRSEQPVYLYFDDSSENGDRYSWDGKDARPVQDGTFVFSAERYDPDPQVISLTYHIGDSKEIHRFAAYFRDSKPTPSGCRFN